MPFKISLAQTMHSSDGPISVIENAARIASDSQADLLVFPESMMTSYETPFDVFVASAEPLDGPYAQAVGAIARRYCIWVACSLNELNVDGSGLPFNTTVIFDSNGTIAGFYRKVHLFDSYQTQESLKMTAGSSLMNPIDAPFCKLGLGICYDLRFPEVARFAATRGAQLLLYPAAWLAGDCKVEQWETLLRSRAIENGVYVAGVCRCDDRYIGHTSLFDPLGRLICACGTEERVVTAEIDVSLVDKARKDIPVLEHLRPELYRN